MGGWWWYSALLQSCRSALGCRRWYWEPVPAVRGRALSAAVYYGGKDVVRGAVGGRGYLLALGMVLVMRDGQDNDVHWWRATLAGETCAGLVLTEAFLLIV